VGKKRSEGKFAVLNKSVRVALVKRCNLSQLERGKRVSQADIRMKRTTGAKTLRWECAWSVHGITKW
jgi:hypothetical protein